jgi:hypothetical protein
MSLLEELRRGPDHSLFAYGEDPVAVISAHGRVAYVNPAFTRRFKVGRAEAVGRPLGEVLPARLAETVLDHFRQISPDSPTTHFWMGAERERFRASMGCIPINGFSAGAVVTIWDAQPEAVVRQQNLELFRAMVDDLRLPLAELASLFDLPDTQQRILRQSGKRGSDQLTESLGRLTDFGEVLFGEVRVEQVPFHPSRLLALTRKSLRSQAAQLGVHLEDGSAHELPRMVGDPSLLLRLLGLLSDYMINSVPRNELVILSAELLLLPNTLTRLAYAVTGTGMLNLAAELTGDDVPLAAAFAGLPDRRKRLMLRTLLARRLVTAMNGTITVAAHESTGTTISVQVPSPIHFSATDSLPPSDYPRM